MTAQKEKSLMTQKAEKLSQLKQETLAVLYGGNSAERDVSLKSGKAIAKGLEQAGFTVQLIDTKNEPLTTLVKQNIKYAFIAVHGRGGEDGCLQGALETLEINYTGSNVLGSALSMDKVRSKQMFKACDIPTAPFAVVTKADFLTLDINEQLSALGGKVMVKPAHEGSSIGMAMADSPEKLRNALVEAFFFDGDVLLEAWIDGPEYTVAILGDEALPAIHMETPHEFYDYKAKYQSTSTQYHCPCGLSEEEENEIKMLSVQAFKATGASGWGRVDLMKSNEGYWQLLEVNTVPGMTETSLVPKAAKVKGLTFSQLVERIVLLSFK